MHIELELLIIKQSINLRSAMYSAVCSLHSATLSSAIYNWSCWSHLSRSAPLSAAKFTRLVSVPLGFWRAGAVGGRLRLHCSPLWFVLFPWMVVYYELIMSSYNVGGSNDGSVFTINGVKFWFINLLFK